MMFAHLHWMKISKNYHLVGVHKLIVCHSAVYKHFLFILTCACRPIAHKNKSDEKYNGGYEDDHTVNIVSVNVSVFFIFLVT